ncbi:hypothetical protein PYX08_13625 [Citrobacter freundii]|nr:hypothetical protein [Citrobacter freundii]
MFDFLMINSEYVSIVGAVLAFVGTIVLAFSLGKVLWEFMFSIDAISTSIESIADGGDIYVVQGLHKRISKAISASKKAHLDWDNISIYINANARLFFISKL